MSACGISSRIWNEITFYALYIEILAQQKCSNQVKYFIANAEAINHCQWPSKYVSKFTSAKSVTN